jgi:broad specificity phosphatase PhoE
MSDMTVVHLLRHGEVSNPRGVLYGRMPGFHLSAEGEHMAKAAAAFLAGRDVTLVLSSPLERARETAAPVAAQFGLEVRVDERLVEPWNDFEGERFDVGLAALRRPVVWPRLVNPFRPSWGEPYADIAARLHAVMADAASEARGHEAVCVSHQLPIWMARRSAEGRRLWHHPGNRECALGSVTSFTYRDGAVTGVSYAEPAGDGRGGTRGA